MQKVLWIITIICSILGTLFFVLTVATSNGAPQQAAGASIALCLAVIPYVLSRAVSELKK